MKTGIGTLSGRIFDPYDMKVEDVNIYDIAWSLKHQNRYNGHTVKPISVLDHLALVFQLYAKDVSEVDPNIAVQLLIHDAGEAFLSDIPRPFKDTLKNIKELETELDDFIFSLFGYHQPDWDTIRRYDWQALHVEMQTLTPELVKVGYAVEPMYEPVVLLPIVETRVDQYITALKMYVEQAGLVSWGGPVFEMPEIMSGLITREQVGEPPVVEDVPQAHTKNMTKVGKPQYGVDSPV